MPKRKNDSLLSDLETTKYPQEKVDSLRQSGIVTYSSLLTALGDGKTDLSIRIVLCEALWSVAKYADKRWVVQPLLAALNSNEPDLSWMAAIVIGIMGLKRAISALSKVAIDKKQPNRTRV